MAITLINSVSAAPGASGGATTAIDTTGATLIVVSASSYAPGPAVSITDSKSNTYTGLTVRTGNPEHRIFYKLSPVVGSGHTFTITGAATYPVIIVYAFAGVAGYDSQESGLTAITSPLACGNVTPSANGALIVTGMASDAAGTDTVPTGFTGGITRAFAGGVNMQGSAAYLVQTTATVINPTWTWTGSHASAGSCAVFTPTIVITVGEAIQFSVVRPD